MDSAKLGARSASRMAQRARPEDDPGGDEADHHHLVSSFLSSGAPGS